MCPITVFLYTRPHSYELGSQVTEVVEVIEVGELIQISFNRLITSIMRMRFITSCFWESFLPGDEFFEQVRVIESAEKDILAHCGLF